MRTQETFQALSDPIRRKILKLLHTQSMTAGELAEAFPITKGTLSHHFNVLKAADLVRTEKRKQQIIYSLNTSVFEDVAAMLLALFKTDKPDNPEETGGTPDEIH
jgi:ArsR family transcriptional regulator